MFSGSTGLGNPKVVLLFSGKRKSGKDYVTSLLSQRFDNEICSIIRLSGPLKSQYAAEHKLDYNRLLDASEYKEIYRVSMIDWSEEIRKKDPGYFCRLAITQNNAETKEVWIISDTRRKSDIDFFRSNYQLLTYTIRIKASEEVRIARGWKFTNGVDDCESECGLDDFTEWDFIVENNGNDQQLDQSINPIIKIVKQRLSCS